MKHELLAGWRARRSLAVVSCTALIAVAVVAGGAGAASATAPAAPKVCREAGITLGVVHKVFSPTGRIGGEGDSEIGRRAIRSSGGGQTPSNCTDGPPKSINTDVTLAAVYCFRDEVKSRGQELDSYGHARKKPFPCAGAGAVRVNPRYARELETGARRTDLSLLGSGRLPEDRIGAVR